jgi:hypothetical protein
LSNGVTAYNPYTKRPCWCNSNKCILIFSITHNSCFVIMFYIATTFCPIAEPSSPHYEWIRKIHRNSRYHKVLTCMQPVPPDQMPTKQACVHSTDISKYIFKKLTVEMTYVMSNFIYYLYLVFFKILQNIIQYKYPYASCVQTTLYDLYIFIMYF